MTIEGTLSVWIGISLLFPRCCKPFVGIEEVDDIEEPDEDEGEVIGEGKPYEKR